MNWQCCIMEKMTSAVYRLRDALARISGCRWKWQWVDLAVISMLAAGVGLISVWLGAIIIFIAIVMLVRRLRHALPISRMANEERDSDESWDSPARRHANMTHEYSYRAFEDD